MMEKHGFFGGSNEYSDKSPDLVSERPAGYDGKLYVDVEKVTRLTAFAQNMMSSEMKKMQQSNTRHFPGSFAQCMLDASHPERV
jgi:hypothetical protein